MKLNYALLPLVALLSGAAAQDLGDLPDCAKSCATGAIPQHCELIDIGCICGDKSFITNISCCVAKACSAVIDFATQLCKGGGITDLPKSASCPAGGDTATETSKSSTSSATSTETKSSKTAASAASTATKSTESAATSSEKTGGSTASTTTPTNSAAATTGGAALLQGSDASIVAVAGAALFAFLA
ncbi:hypothetical protein FE257_011938 [Aspergillus nanangensis]|uniref:CFEM domain-containing protein n=1 Tax=Aspergillus nanangensis TaxID=2582783 RepID=A0AAD4CGV1_ASPNN|nr:hypothetical protein FE257_011938 [Aspergillus nanangensis]